MEKIVSVPIYGDTVAETDEVFSVQLSNPSHVTIGTGTASMTIVNDDSGLPNVTITANDANAAEQGTDTGQFTVTRSGSNSGALVVSYVVSGSATPGDDYTELAGTVTIPKQPSGRLALRTLLDPWAAIGDAVLNMVPGAHGDIIGSALTRVPV
jgi:hypothetical protein